MANTFFYWEKDFFSHFKNENFTFASYPSGI